MQCKRRAPTDTLFKNLKIIPFLDVNTYMISRFMFRYDHGSLPAPFEGYFIRNVDVHSHNTRQALHFHPPLIKNELSKKSIKYRGSIVWNYLLDLGMHSETSELVFIKKVKYFIRNGTLLFLRTVK